MSAALRSMKRRASSIFCRVTRPPHRLRDREVVELGRDLLRLADPALLRRVQRVARDLHLVERPSRRPVFQSTITTRPSCSRYARSMRRNTSVPETWKETRSSSASQLARETAKARASVSLRKKLPQRAHHDGHRDALVLLLDRHVVLVLEQPEAPRALLALAPLAEHHGVDRRRARAPPAPRARAARRSPSGTARSCRGRRCRPTAAAPTASSAAGSPRPRAPRSRSSSSGGGSSRRCRAARPTRRRARPFARTLARAPGAPGPRRASDRRPLAALALRRAPVLPVAVVVDLGRADHQLEPVRQVRVQRELALQLGETDVRRVLEARLLREPNAACGIVIVTTRGVSPPSTRSVYARPSPVERKPR